MWRQPENDQFADELFLAGERVPPGTYKQIGSSDQIRLDREDFLPASLDGRVACYMRIQDTWDKWQAKQPVRIRASKNGNTLQAVGAL
jgi:hypothetical protein